jgi:putative SOS response-associated peptidase YedK
MKLATFNARIETVTEKPMFRGAFQRTRCLIPASGYYEWHDTPDGKQPYYFTRRDGAPIALASLWDEWPDRQAGETIRSCAMIHGRQRVRGRAARREASMTSTLEIGCYREVPRP